MKILLVDDNRLMLEGLQNLLEGPENLVGAHDIQIAGTAKDGLEAIALARKLKPDIILMDIRMPGCDGLTATRLIKSEMTEIKIVILTTSTEDQDLFEAVKSGACGYLLKSMEADELIEALEQVQQGIPPFSPGLAAKLLGEFTRLAEKEKAFHPTSPPQKTEAINANKLTGRQVEVLDLIAQGLSYKEAGARLGLSHNTIKYHLVEIMQQLHLENRTQVIAYAANLRMKGDKTVK